MKTLITVIILFTLVGCTDTRSNAYGTSRAFFNSDCKDSSYISNVTDDGTTRTLTITCTK